jgi:hypothetical protein
MNKYLTKEDYINLGRKGGKKKTIKQTKARQLNGLKGGRPKGIIGFDPI